MLKTGRSHRIYLSGFIVYHLCVSQHTKLETQWASRLTLGLCAPPLAKEKATDCQYTCGRVSQIPDLTTNEYNRQRHEKELLWVVGAIKNGCHLSSVAYRVSKRLTTRADFTKPWMPPRITSVCSVNKLWSIAYRATTLLANRCSLFCNPL
jgi:hypothetical protein